MGIKHNYTATGTNDGTKQVSVTRWNNEHIIDSEIVLPAFAPPVPAAGNLGVFAQDIGGRMMLSQIGPSGLDTALQPHLGGNKVAVWMPPGNATTVPGVFGMGEMTATGTAAARTVATTSLLTRMTRLGYVSIALPAALSGIREGQNKFTTGAGGGLGGFHYRARFGVSDPATVSGARMFVGLSSTTAAPTNVEPNTLVNSVGVAQLSTSTNLHFYCAGASTTTAIDLGVNFPAATLSADAYELAMFSSASSGNISYRVLRLNTGAVATGTISTGLPTSTTLMGHQIWRTNNATALAVGIDVAGIYMETDY
jgi:hypothetical protein